VSVSLRQAGIIPETDKKFYETKRRGYQKIYCCYDLRFSLYRRLNKNCAFVTPPVATYRRLYRRSLPDSSGLRVRVFVDEVGKQLSRIVRKYRSVTRERSKLMAGVAVGWENWIIKDL